MRTPLEHAIFRRIDVVILSHHRDDREGIILILIDVGTSHHRRRQIPLLEQAEPIAHIVSHPEKTRFRSLSILKGRSRTICRVSQCSPLGNVHAHLQGGAETPPVPIH